MLMDKYISKELFELLDQTQSKDLILKDWIEKYETPEKVDVSVDQIKGFTEENIKGILEAIELSNLKKQIFQSVLNESSFLPVYDISKFRVTSINEEEVNEVLGNILEGVLQLQYYKEEVNHYLALCRFIVKFLSAYRNKLKEFLLQYPFKFKGLSGEVGDKKTFRNTLYNGVGGTLDEEIDGIDLYVKAFSKVIDNVIDSRISILNKAEAGIRLLIRTKHESNWCLDEDENKKESKEDDDVDELFEIEKVEKQ